MYDMLFKGALIVDGTGSKPYRADLGVVGDRIARIGVDIDGRARRCVQLEGKCLAPGFIDAHTHSDFTLLADPRAESAIRQGVTTEVIGNCGISAAPILGAAAQETAAHSRLLGVDVDWSDMASYLGRVNRACCAVNVVALVGHSTIRASVLGYGDAQPDQPQLGQMGFLLREAILQGARGMSTGMFYPPGSYATPEEVVSILEQAKRVDLRLICSSHIRDEATDVLRALEEAVSIGERSGVPVEVSHLKLSGSGAQCLLEELLATMDTCAYRGVDVGFDLYPYTMSMTWLRALLPRAEQQGGAARVAQHVTDERVRQRLRNNYQIDLEGWRQRSGVQGWDSVVVVFCPGDEGACGCSIAELSEQRKAPGLEVVLDLIAASQGLAEACTHDQTEEVVGRLIAHPAVAIGSDGSAVSPDGRPAGMSSHPRSYGCFPRVLSRYVRELGVLTLQEAVRKMTSLTAERYALTDRGIVREGAFADITVFDASTITDRATERYPTRFPTGVDYVLVNGKMVLTPSGRTGESPGRVL